MDFNLLWVHFYYDEQVLMHLPMYKLCIYVYKNNYHQIIVKTVKTNQ